MPLIYRLPPTQGLFSRLLSAAVVMVVFAVALFLGAAIFLAILGIAVVAGIALYLRFWWLRRQQLRHPPAGPGGGVTLEGEYTASKSGRNRGDGQR